MNVNRGVTERVILLSEEYPRANIGISRLSASLKHALQSQVRRTRFDKL